MRLCTAEVEVALSRPIGREHLGEQGQLFRWELARPGIGVLEALPGDAGADPVVTRTSPKRTQTQAAPAWTSLRVPGSHPGPLVELDLDRQRAGPARPLGRGVELVEDRAQLAFPMSVAGPAADL